MDTETDLTFDDCLTWAEWWDEFHANACCPNSSVAAARLCGCGGSGELPSGVSRLLIGDPE
ncbi:hypothetical protein Jolie1_096 [Mycobacterium phage Julie1]|jgi:hypothetical protein|uniref:Uncharacterized protein n=1 Tax=Mycobacterium phage Julie1 TaxID=1463812 RepID=W8ECU2_9CAUD|nr:hypothetical protein CG90_gp96 [Mycobacterium phage Julie1]AHJ88596.1 hypothetical protein Jolie1_096 [Mycobacterium phage Julie1]